MVGYLTEALRITRDVKPMTWQFLEPPPDGTVMLVWQSSQLGSQFASDGLVWADAEKAYSQDMGGFVSSTPLNA